MACEAAGAADQLVSQRRPDWAFLGFAAPTLSLILVGLVYVSYCTYRAYASCI